MISTQTQISLMQGQHYAKDILPFLLKMNTQKNCCCNHQHLVIIKDEYVGSVPTFNHTYPKPSSPIEVTKPEEEVTKPEEEVTKPIEEPTKPEKDNNNGNNGNGNNGNGNNGNQNNNGNGNNNGNNGNHYGNDKGNGNGNNGNHYGQYKNNKTQSNLFDIKA